MKPFFTYILECKESLIKHNWDKLHTLSKKCFKKPPICFDTSVSVRTTSDTQHERCQTNHIPFSSLGKALDRLDEAVKKPIAKQHDTNIDATIHRFRNTIILYLQILKDSLSTANIETQNPEQTLQEAYKIGWIDEEKLWLSMIEDKNLIPYSYKEEVAMQIYHNIQEYYPAFRATYDKLTSKYSAKG